MMTTMYRCLRGRCGRVSHLGDFRRDPETGVLTCAACFGPAEPWQVDFAREQEALAREQSAAVVQRQKSLDANRQERLAWHRLRHAKEEFHRCQFEKERGDRRYGVNGAEGTETRQALLTAQRELAVAEAAWQAARTDGGRRDG
jgi:hypothetical protein